MTGQLKTGANPIVLLLILADPLGHVFKNFLYPLSTLCTALKMFNTFTGLLCLSLGDDSFAVQINFVANQNQQSLRIIDILPDLLQPIRNVLQAIFTSAIVDQNHSPSLLIVGLGNCVEPLLPSGVPDLKF